MLHGKTGVTGKAYPIFGRIRGGKRVITMIASLRRFDKVVSRWKKRLKSSGGGLTSLIPYSTRPIRLRRPQTRA